MTEETESTTCTVVKKTSIPPEGYVCNLCKVPGHWIQQCDQKDTRKKNKKRKKSSHHEYQEGVDPSPKDIDRAREMQKIKPPQCDCGITSRLKKVKRSHATENSRANGSYFFFCSKKKDDSTKCNFAKPVDDLQKNKKDKIQSNFFAKKRKET